MQTLLPKPQQKIIKWTTPEVTASHFAWKSLISSLGRGWVSGPHSDLGLFLRHPLNSQAAEEHRANGRKKESRCAYERDAVLATHVSQNGKVKYWEMFSGTTFGRLLWGHLSPTSFHWVLESMAWRLVTLKGKWILLMSGSCHLLDKPPYSLFWWEWLPFCIIYRMTLAGDSVKFSLDQMCLELPSCQSRFQ